MLAGECCTAFVPEGTRLYSGSSMVQQWVWIPCNIRCFQVWFGWFVGVFCSFFFLCFAYLALGCFFDHSKHKFWVAENLFLPLQSGSIIPGQNVIFSKAELGSPSQSQYLTCYVCMVLSSYAFYPFLNMCYQNRSKGVNKFSLPSFDRHLANNTWRLWAPVFAAA